VLADPGAIGGSGSQEFMVLADAGEDEVLYTEDGQYAANVEKAVSLPETAPTVYNYEKKLLDVRRLQTLPIPSVFPHRW